METPVRTVLLIGSAFLVRHTFGQLISKEVCILQTFKANCSAGTVIAIQSALYGRMQSSRCLRFGNTDLDCYANVQPYLESLCNGLVECNIAASDETLRGLYKGRCLNNLTPYLVVNYTCAQDIGCDSYDPPEDVTVEDVTSGHRISCISDRSISWEVHCDNGTWISDRPALKNCHSAVTEKPTSNHAFESISLANGQPSLEKNMMIIALCATVAVIIVSGNYGCASVHTSTERSQH